ncbi:hypothetical protein M404DRAFT_35607 [Pisolithus tinctorius Marx 270]|uniref:Uncharacterized protein n=1 Tax=Pisolithus tinctorius Marx 270 TaxID=870435 RepID=A0A0C3IA01_PISTI|nr:hypothetical protein M404DRAFT_35607 [Pisolithus tinctorius Marx 270]
MSDLRLITVTNNDESWVLIDWTQVLGKVICYNTNDEEEMMKVKEEQAQLVAERQEREQVKAKRAERERAEANCTHCAQAKVVCGFLVDGNKKDKEDAEVSPKASGKVDKGKKQKIDEENAKAGPSKKKWAKSKLIEVLDINKYKVAEGRLREAGMGGLIANNLASLYELHKTMIMNSGQIADHLEAILNESYGFGMAVTPSDSGSSELDADEL